MKNARSIRNKTKELSAILELNEILICVCVESWISNTPDDNFLLQQCFPRGFKFFNAPRINERGGGICTFYRSDFLFKIFDVSSDYFECCLMILKAEGITLLLIAVYRTPGGNVKSFIENFTHFLTRKGCFPTEFSAR